MISPHIDRIQRTWGAISQRHTTDDKQVYQQFLKELQQNFDEKNEDGFSSVLKYAKKRIVVDFERSQGDRWFWQLAKQDLQTVETAIKDIMEVIKEQGSLVFEEENLPNDFYQALLEKLEKCYTRRNKEGFIRTVEEAKNKIMEDISMILRQDQVKRLVNNDFTLKSGS